MCAARVRPERPECLVRQDAACASGHTFFFLMAPWRVSAGTKRRWEAEEEGDAGPVPKTQKTAAADIMDTEPMWESEEDF